MTSGRTQRNTGITTSRIVTPRLAAGVALAVLLGCSATQSAPSVAEHERAGRGDTTVALLDDLPRPAASDRDLAGMRGEHVASFIEERSAAGGGIADRAAFDAWRSRATGAVADAPASGRDVVWERTVSRLQGRLERTFAERGLPWPGDQLAFGALVTGDPLPVLLQVPGTGGRLAVVDERLFDLVYAVVSAALATPRGGVPASCDELVHSLPSLVRPRFGWAMRLFVRGRHDGRYDLAPGRPEELVALVRGAELFVLAHEYAHVAQRHVPVAVDVPFIGRSDRLRSPLSVLRYSPAEELAADALAFELVQHTIRRSGTETEKTLAPFGPELMLFVSELLETARVVYDQGAPPAGPGILLAGAETRSFTSGDTVDVGAGAPSQRRSLAARRAALRGARLARGATPHGGSWDAASFVERTARCLFSSVAPGLATAGANGRTVEEMIASTRALQLAKAGSGRSRER